MYVVLTLLVIFPLAIAGKVLWLYGKEGSELREQGDRQAKAVQDIPAMRGAVLDQSGRQLAVNTARYVVGLDPTAEGFDEQKDSFFDRLSNISGVPAGVLRRRVQNRSSTQYVQLIRDVSESVKDELMSWSVPGLILEPQFNRRYNYESLAGHLLGHVNTDLEGIAGLEMKYGEYLRGTPGRRAMQRDRLGFVRARVGGRVVEPEHGERLVLTIDLLRQAIMEDELKRGMRESGAERGIAIAMNPRTGAVQGMVSLPGYNPNQPSAYSRARRRNRAITDQLEPGSTFKLVTAVAALEQGVVELSDSIDTGEGWTVFHGRTMKDVHAYGRVSFADAIVHSSNVGVAKTARELEPGVFYQYARNLGFGQATGIDLPGEAFGNLKKPHTWSGTTQPWMSIGYEVEVTPIQLLAAYSALANDGTVMQPYVVAERQDMAGNTVWSADPTRIRQAFDPSTARALVPVFERVVEEGTATAAQVDGLRIAGKTGTANKVVAGIYESGTRASFAGFFPADDPRAAIVIILDDPQTSSYGGRVAAPIFGRIASRWQGTFPVRPDSSTTKPPEKLVRTVPEVTGIPAALAQQRLESRDLRVRRDGSPAPDARVVAQQPEAGASVDARTTIAIQTQTREHDTAEMPDVRGMSLRQAVAWLTGRGISVTVYGSGTVVRQQPSAGDGRPNRAVLYGN
jgi:cell division protein FtsI (penicillin-binding protein 3)